MLRIIKTLLKFIDLKWGAGKNKPEELSGYSLIFIDNKFENFFEQIEIFFNSGFLNKKKTILVVKFYKNNYYKIFENANRLGIRVVFYLFYRQIPILDGKIIFYPYNSQSNCRLILNRNARHVFLTHGESNKKASINRMVRLYDHVLAAGDFSRQRYLESEIFTSHDIEAGRVIRVGAALSAQCFEYLSFNATQPCIAYMPTWEGGLEDENFSSIAIPQVVDILCGILNYFKINCILIKCHPNTGGRIKSYKDALAIISRKLLSRGVDVHVDPSSMHYLDGYSSIRAALKSGDENLKIRFGVVDISAAEFMLAAKKIPTVVLLRKKEKCFAPLDYWRIREKSIINLDDGSSVEDAIDYLKSSGGIDEFILKSFSLENNLKEETAQKIGEILIDRWHNEMQENNVILGKS